MSQTDDLGDEAGDPVLEAKRLLLAAALPHVAFDGWTSATIDAAAREAGVDANLAKIAFPRGGVDLAVFHHQEGDRLLTDRLRAAPLAAMRVRDRVALGVRARLEIAEERREAVRKAASLFALPVYAADGARAVWGTADVIWEAIGDPSDDLNWYTKRAILSSVISATTLYWLGDESEGREASWAFLDRRIDSVMQFEKVKAAVNKNPLGKLLMTGPNWVASRIRKPGGPRETGAPSDLPG
ncbi:MAG: COQ9 family protein [Pseudomonadota bacterium]